jgi:hypothetical protein
MQTNGRERTAQRLDFEYVSEDGAPDKGGFLKAMNIRPKLPAPSGRPNRDTKNRENGLRRGVVQLQAADPAQDRTSRGVLKCAY